MVYRRVNMAEMVVTSSDDVLAIYGLGSCLGVALHDPTRGIGAMAHVMLPCDLTNNPVKKPGKYVDTAIGNMVEELEKLGCDRKDMVAKICGGSRMFKTSREKKECIGTKNIKLTKKLLKSMGIPIVAKDVGGNYGRIVEFDVKSGKMYIRTASGTSKVL